MDEGQDRPQVRRRTLVAALTGGAVSLAGCSGLELSGPTRTPYGVPPTRSENGDDDTETAESIEDGRQTGTVPGNLERSIPAAVGPSRRLVVGGGTLTVVGPAETTVVAGFSRPATATSPARLWVGLRKGSDRTDIAFGQTPPFSGYRGVAYPATGPPNRFEYLLVPVAGTRFDAGPTRAAVPDRPVDGCWVADQSTAYSLPAGVVDDNREPLVPGEWAIAEYAFLSAPGAEGCLPPAGRGAFVFRGVGDEPSFAVSVFDPGVATPAASRYAKERSPPPLPGSDRVRWFHSVAGDPLFGRRRVDPAVYLELDPERVVLPGAVDARLYNYSTVTVGVSAADYELYKFHDGGWRFVAPQRPPFVVRGVPPAETIDLRLRLTRTVPADGTDRDTGSGTGRGGRPLERTVGGLGGGVYALRLGDSPADLDESGPFRPSPGGTAGSRERLAYAALLELVGDPLDVTPPPEAAVRGRRDGTVTVGLGTGDEVGLVVDRNGADGSGDQTALVAEQVVRIPTLRAALSPFEDDVDRVVVVTDRPRVESALEPLGRVARTPPRQDPVDFAFRGTAYRASVRRSPTG